MPKEPKPDDSRLPRRDRRAANCERSHYYKVEKLTRDGTKVERMLYAGNNLDYARMIFDRAIKHRPKIRLTIRQRTRVLQQWPKRSAEGGGL